MLTRTMVFTDLKGNVVHLQNVDVSVQCIQLIQHAKQNGNNKLEQQCHLGTTKSNFNGGFTNLLPHFIVGLLFCFVLQLRIPSEREKKEEVEDKKKVDEMKRSNSKKKKYADDN